MFATKHFAAGCVALGLIGSEATVAEGDAKFVPLDVVVLRVQADSQVLATALEDNGPTGEADLHGMIRSLQEAYEWHRRDEMPNRQYRDNLITLYNAAAQYDSYRAVLFSDIVKRLILEWVRQALQRTDGREAELRELRGIVEALALDPTRLRSLQRAAGVDNEQQDEDFQSLSAQIKAIARSHGYKTSEEWLVDMVSRPPTSIESLISQPQGERAAVAMLVTEMVRAVRLNGTIEFLIRGGDPALASAIDVTYFRTIVSYRDSKAFAFPLFGVKVLKPSHVLSVLETEKEGGDGIQYSWMKYVFDQK